MKEFVIRAATEADFDAMWQIFQELATSGDALLFGADTTREDGHAYWFGAGVQSFVALLNGERLVGMYRLLAKQRDRGAHVANAAVMVSPSAQGVGVGQLLGADSLERARAQGFLAMQFDYVVSSNTTAVLLWKKLGFTIVGTLPLAYYHQYLGYVDVYIMYQLLQDPPLWPDA